MKTAIIYLRVSSAQQAKKELPIESQLKFAKKKAEDLNANVIATFTDSGISGRTDRRQDFQAAIAFCEQYKPDFFIAWDTARFARNRIDAAMYKRDLRALGTDVVYVSVDLDSSTDEGWFMEALLEVMDENTSRRISKDTKRSMIKNAEDGFFNGGNVPFGYQTQAQGERKRLVINEGEATVVRDMFQMCLQGIGATTIAHKLNSVGRLQRGKRWSRSSINFMLKNRVYTGLTIFGRYKNRVLQPQEAWTCKKSHEAIIDEKLFEAVQDCIEDRAPQVAGGTPRSHHLLVGLFKCHVCGGAMHTESGTGRNGTSYHYYRCGQAKTGLCENKKRINATEMDEFVAHSILDEILTEERVISIIRDIETATESWWKERSDRRQQLVASLRDAERRQNNLFNILENHGMDTPNLGDLTIRLRQTKTEIEGAKKALAELDGTEIPELNINEAMLAKATAALRGIVTECDDPIIVRQFFASFVDKIVVEGDALVIKYQPQKLMNHGLSTVVHSGDRWLPDLDSNQGPAD
ncbi:recombinase family protein [Herbaspirillum huttiense]|uniref:recombinase family protein n=1 Tax=Herbaspirillum huttiense TaxID=863372 RepID=UPI003826A35E